VLVGTSRSEVELCSYDWWWSIPCNNFTFNLLPTTEEG